METILSIAGKPGLYKLVNRGNRNLIVEAIDATHRRMPAFASDRVTSLADIAMYTDAEDIPLWQVLKSLGEKEQSKECSLNYKKCSADELHAFFAEVCLHTIVTVFTIQTSRNSSSGITSSSTTASPILRQHLLLLKVIM